MGSSFEAECPDCGHQWCGGRETCWLGPDILKLERTQTWFCPSSYHSIVLPKESDRETWRSWSKPFLESPHRPVWMRELLNRIGDILESTNWCETHSIELGSLTCPMCPTPMIKDRNPKLMPAICLGCGLFKFIETVATSHYSPFYNDDQFY